MSLACIVLFTSLGGTTYAWDSPPIIAMVVDRRAAARAASRWSSGAPNEPIMPLELFRKPVFAVTSAVGFIVGLALFGAVTYLPLLPPGRQGAEPDPLRA